MDYSRGSRNTPSHFMLQKPGISSGSYGPLGSKGFICYLFSSCIVRFLMNCTNHFSNPYFYYTYVDLITGIDRVNIFTNHKCSYQISLYQKLHNHISCTLIHIFWLSSRDNVDHKSPWRILCHYISTRTRHGLWTADDEEGVVPASCLYNIPTSCRLILKV